MHGNGWMGAGSVMPTLRSFAIMAAAVSLAAPVAASANMADVVAAAYEDYSLSAPTPDLVIICHGFGCKYRAEVALSAADHAALAHILAAGKASPAAERQAVAAAWAWFDRRIAPAAGTRNHVASAGVKYMYDTHQFDCVDASRNTTRCFSCWSSFISCTITRSMCRNLAASSSTGGRRITRRCCASGRPA